MYLIFRPVKLNYLSEQSQFPVYLQKVYTRQIGLLKEANKKFTKGKYERVSLRL